MSPDLDYVALLPEIALSVTLVAVLAADLLLPRTRKYWVAIVALVGVTLTAIPLIYLAIEGDLPSVMVDGGYVVDEFALALKGLFVVSGYLVLLMSVSYIESERYYQGEYYFLLVASILGSVVMASSRDLITLFIGLELVTGPLFLLAGWRKGDVKSNEASLKFFLIGVLSTALLLVGDVVPLRADRDGGLRRPGRRQRRPGRQPGVRPRRAVRHGRVRLQGDGGAIPLVGA